MTAQYQYLCLQLQTVCRVHRALLIPHHLAWFSASSRLWPPCQNQPKTKRHSAFANFWQVYLLQGNLGQEAFNQKRTITALVPPELSLF